MLAKIKSYVGTDLLNIAHDKYQVRVYKTPGRIKVTESELSKCDFEDVEINKNDIGKITNVIHPDFELVEKWLNTSVGNSTLCRYMNN